MNNNYLIGVELAQNENIEELSKLRLLQQQDDWQEEFEDKNNLLEITKEYMNKHLNKDLYIFVQKMNNEIIATCGIQIIEYMPRCNDLGKEGYICNVFTKREHRNQGIQTRLLKRCIQFARDNNLTEIKLSSDNEQAISIYKKIGFEFDCLAMKLILK